ncbi:integral membrane protein, YjbE family [Marininema mesophilum]|uniref:Integral membrane protein, YjbE family n=1 Tax=Marininema mesophilum TaxID=1048340 RepID=A0A1H2ZIG6_9BACL|nr:TerC family protein [Marininema mesophilum]SDX16758.1 integral membrane protein, YjbE family [Marininema mesophilum]
MELFSLEFFQALLTIIIIDLVLAGDNAIVIGLAARNLPKDKQKSVILWGTVGAVVIRALATLAVVWLLKIPGLLLVGGLMLVWIAYKLLIEDSDTNVKAAQSTWGAIQTIIIADAVMGLDNVIAVAGAAHSNYLLVVIGLLISIPVVVWGSTIVLKLIEKYPIIITIGAGVLAYTAGKMLTDDKLTKAFFSDQPLIKWGLILIIVASVILVGHFTKKKRAANPS